MISTVKSKKMQMFHLYFRNNLVSVDNEDRSIKVISSFVLNRFLCYFLFYSLIIFNDMYCLYNIFYYLIIKNINIHIHYRSIKVSI